MPVEFNKLPHVVELLHTGKIITRQGDYMLVLESSAIQNADSIRTPTDELLVLHTYVMFQVRNGEVQKVVRRFHQEGTPEQCCNYVFNRFCAAVEQVRAVSKAYLRRRDAVI